MKVSMWWRAVRPFSFTVSILPPILGAVIAISEIPDVRFNRINFILTAIGCVLAHAGANLLSDYYDFKNSVDRKGTFGSSGLLVDGSLLPVQILRAAWLTLAIAAAIGIYLIAVVPNGIFLIYLVVIGAVLGIFYTAGPFSFKYHALGDIAVFISFGSAMTLGAFYVQTGQFSWIPVLYALPLGLLVDAVLHGNNLRDIANDSVVNIKTFAMVLGEKYAKVMYYGLIIGAYVITVVLILAVNLTPLAFVTFLSLPLAVKLIRMVRNKRNLEPQEFAVIDAATAQFHTAFGVLFLSAILIQHFVIG
ncbi:1,4-dihydroxy-2-naphthoate octaprenyltransferase [candidate division KSB1 bacterium]|nr:1,4-dihydroxy-2-naphthoate octaprenyltransferase [candidate division KSB1 bacterium]